MEIPIISAIGPFIAQALGYLTAVVTGYLGYIFMGWFRGLTGRFIKKQIDRAVTLPMIFGEYSMNYQDWLSPRRRPFKKHGKRIARWMRR